MGDIPGFRLVRPGLYERTDTPTHVPISGRLLDAIRAESPHLAEILERIDSPPPATSAHADTGEEG